MGAFRFEDKVKEVIRTLPNDQAAELDRHALQVVLGSSYFDGLWGGRQLVGKHSIEATARRLVNEYTYSCLDLADKDVFFMPTTKEAMARTKVAEELAGVTQDRFKRHVKDTRPKLRERGEDSAYHPEKAQFLAPLLGFIGIRSTLVSGEPRKSDFNDIELKYWEELLLPVRQVWLYFENSK